MKKQIQSGMGFVSKDSEEDNNKYSAKLVLIFLCFFFLMFGLNELGFFYVEKNVMRAAFVSDFVCIALIWILAFIPAISSWRKTKYIIILLGSAFTLISMTALNFHAVLCLCIPMIIALNYHSRKLSVLTFFTTICCAFLAPVLGVLLNTWQASYFVSLIYAIDPGLVPENLKQLAPLLVNNISATQIAMDFISVPQFFFALMFGIAIVITNRRKRSMFDQQIESVKESRDTVLGAMADIVENRDFNTGGHIKRTGKVMEILTDTLKQDPEFKNKLSDEYCDCIIKTSAMHDLGKIAIPDSILGKPGKLTPKEFEYIKIHPQKSYEIVGRILEALNDEQFQRVAENIALYHHEKYDGSGYPKGLKGDEIPLEARLMAIADVYDALVSKRCYKEAMSHEKAYEIIEESMGTHFDPKLRTCFEKAYPRIVEDYLIAKYV